MALAQAPSDGRGVDPAEVEALLRPLAEAVGADHVLRDEPARALHSQDVYRAGVLPLAVVRPGTTAEVAAVLRAATERELAVFARGGGMSYTDAYLPDRTRSIVLDLGRLDRVREIAADDLHVTVEAGCTWAALDAALAPHGLRAVFWGPMSGRRATIGGGLSQGAATFGSGRNGTSAGAALGVEVVLADGSVLVTGSAAQAGASAFFRHHGPDLTGLFTNDAGALGIKTAVTLALEPRPAAGDGLCFAFGDFDSLLGACRAVARAGLATEGFGLESALLREVAGAQTRRDELRALFAAGRAQGSALRGALQMARIAWHGRRFTAAAEWIGGFLVEGRDRRELAAAAARIRAACRPHGRETANTLAAVTRATPFPEPMLLGPGGRRLLPLHAILPWSRALAFHREYQALLARERASLERHGVQAWIVYALLGRNAFLYEPVFYWPDEWPALHRAAMPPAVLAAMREGAPNPAARAEVERLRLASVALMRRHGATHLQLGRAYPYLEGRAPANLALLRALKAELDPRGLVNPGALGL